MVAEHDLPVEKELVHFAKTKVDETLWVDGDLKLTPISGDAGFRRYYRLNTRMPMLAVWAPVETENSLQFSLVAKMLLHHGVRTPRVFELDLDQGFLLVEDFGGRLLLDELNDANVDGYYAEAMTMLLHMQAASVDANDPAFIPAYSETLLLEEMNLFDDWFLDKLLGIELSAEEKACVEETKQVLLTRALAQQQVLVHRDFHSRNLLVLGSGSLATIDFQDAVWGPITYDLVSLVKDCYVVWPVEKVERWAKVYASMASSAGILELESEASFLKDFHLMGLQRHIKVLGIFSRLHLRDGKAQYVKDLPTVLNYVENAAGLYPELEVFSLLLKSRIKPLASKILD